MNDIDIKFHKEIYQKLGSSRCVTVKVFINSKRIELKGVVNIDELKYITELSEKYLKDLEDAKAENKSEKKCHSCDGKKYYVSYDGYYDPCRICNPKDKLNILK
jgi:hypothetical protein